MTSSELAMASLRETGSRTAGGAGVVACGFCRRRLSDEFFFMCRKCDASYCYIHMSRHEPATCARQAKKKARVGAAAEGHGLEEGAIAHGGVPLIRAGPNPRDDSSANV